MSATPHPVTVDPARGLTLVRRDGTIIAASLNGKRVIEDGLPDRLYLPKTNTLNAAHAPSAKTTHCPRKGDAAYFDLPGAPDAAWTYYDPLPPVADMAAHVSYDDAAASMTLEALPSVPDEAAGVLSFWFDKVGKDDWFRQDDALDERIKERFRPLLEKDDAGALDAWDDHPHGALARLILLDQFCRNMFRGKAEAFARDARALASSERMIERGFDLALSDHERAFAYMPFMHSPTLQDQNRCVALFLERLPGAQNVAYALGHRETIHRHGRFPGRDEALGRQG